MRHDQVVGKLAHSVTVGLQRAHPTTVYRRLICSDDAHRQRARTGVATLIIRRTGDPGFYRSSLIMKFYGKGYGKTLSHKNLLLLLEIPTLNKIYH